MDQNKHEYAEINLKARSDWRLFYEKLEQYLKRYQPLDYAKYIANRIKEAKTDIQLAGRMPLHFVAHSLEACCRYARGQNKDVVDYNGFARVINLYHDHNDVVQTSLLKINFQYFFMVTALQQFDFQYYPHKYDLVRVWELFVASNPVPTISQAFFAHNGLSIEEWVQFCFAFYAATNKKIFIKKQYLTQSKVFVNKAEKINQFIKLISFTVKEIGARYEEKKLKTPLQFHLFIKSVFLERPLINFGDDLLFAPFPELLMKHANEGIYPLVKSLPKFDQEFGKSVQNYTKRILSELQNILKIYSDNEIKSLLKGEHCDFVCELPDEVLLVESKAVTYTPRLLLEEVIKNDNSTNKVVKGLKQLYETAGQIKNGALSELGISNTKPVIALIVTYGDIPFPNSDWYYNTFFIPVAQKLFPSGIPEVMQFRPAIMSLGCFELFIRYALTGKSILTIFKEKNEQRYEIVGDWEVYLKAKLSELGNNAPAISYVDKRWGEIFQTMGVST